MAQGFTLQFLKFVQLFIIHSLLPFWQAAIYLSFLIEKNPVLSSLAYYLLLSLAVMTYLQENDSKLQCLWSQRQSELLGSFEGKSDFIFNTPGRNNPYPIHFLLHQNQLQICPHHIKTWVMDSSITCDQCQPNGCPGQCDSCSARVFWGQPSSFVPAEMEVTWNDSYYSFFRKNEEMRYIKEHVGRWAHFTTSLKSVFKCFMKVCKHPGATVHKAATHIYFKLLSSVSFTTLPEMSGQEPKTDFSPKRTPALKGGAGRSWRGLAQLCACAVQRQENSVLWWELLDWGTCPCWSRCLRNAT